MKLFRILSIAVLAGLLLTACGAGGTPTPADTPMPAVIADDTILAEGRLEPIRYVEVALNASGLVSEVLVAEGDKVKAGQVIARLVSDEARTLEDAQAQAAQKLTEAYQEVRDAQYDLDNFDVPTDFSGMTPPEAVEMTLLKLDEARQNFEPYKDLSDKRLQYDPNDDNDKEIYKNTAKLYKKRLDDAWAKYRKAIQWLDLESNLESAQAQVTQAQNDYDNLQDPSFAEDTAGTRAALANAEVRAPFSGVVTNLDLKVGEYAASGNPVVTIADMSNWVVKTTDLTEIDVVSVSDGQPVTVKLDAIPETELKGNVFAVKQNYSENQGDIVYEVTILLTDKHPAMRWGMTADVEFAQ
ncbi:MAG: HlyD family secretion protein [Chloroflexota bacterium]